MRRFLLAVTLVLSSLSARADGLDMFLNNNTVSADYLSSFRGADVNIGMLFNNRSDWVANAGLLVLGREYGGNNKVEGGFGGKVFLSSLNGTSMLAIGIGGQAIYFPRSSKFGFGGFAYYAPDITTNGGRSFLQYGARAEYQLIETASIYLGVHNITAELDSGASRTVDDGIHVGINLRF
jgi:hypothetical protein